MIINLKTIHYLIVLSFTKKNKFALSIWGKNLTNQDYAIRGYSFVLEPYTTSEYTNNKSDYRSYGEKQSLGITFQYSL